MNIIELKKMISNIVSEEIRRTLPQVLDEYYESRKNTGNSLKEEQNTQSDYSELNDEVNTSEKINESLGVDLSKVKEQNKPMKTYVKDPVLNSILNETVCKIPAEGSMVASSILPSGKQSIPIASSEEESKQSKSVLPMKNYGEILKKSKQKGRGSLGNNLGFSIEG